MTKRKIAPPPRRQWGTGSVFQRKSDNRWACQISTGSGKNRIVVRRYAPLSDNCREKAEELLAETLKDAAQPGRTTTLAEYLTRWVSENRNLRPASRRDYEVIIRLHLGEIAGTPLHRLVVRDIDMAMAHLLAEGLSPKTVKNVLYFLRAALKSAEAERLVERNEARFVRTPRQVRVQRPQLTPQQVGAFLACVRDRQDALLPLWMLVAMTGMRSGELLGLRWADVHPDHLTLNQQLARLTPAEVRREGLSLSGVKFDAFGKAYVLMPLKTDRSHRVQPLPPSVATALAAYRPADVEPSQLVFVSARGGPINASWLSHRFQDLCAEAGLPRVVLHSLRATVASIASASGTISPKTASALLGHSQVSTTQDVYAVALTPELRSAANHVEAAILGE